MKGLVWEALHGMSDMGSPTRKVCCGRPYVKGLV